MKFQTGNISAGISRASSDRFKMEKKKYEKQRETNRTNAAIVASGPLAYQGNFRKRHGKSNINKAD